MEFEPGTQRRPSLIKPLEGEIDEAGVMQLRVQYGWVSTHSEGGALLLVLKMLVLLARVPVLRGRRPRGAPEAARLNNAAGGTTAAPRLRLRRGGPLHRRGWRGLLLGF